MSENNIESSRELLSGDVAMDEKRLDQQIRPVSFDAYVGQKSTVDNLRIFSQAARERGEPLDHILLSGPPGLGKTTMAHILAHEMNVPIHTTSGPAIEKKGDLAGLLTNLGEGDVLFIDEIHRLTPVVEENLYPAMEDFQFDVVIGEGAHARSISLDLKPFTLVGATTKTGLLTSPLRDRFGFSARLDFYTVEELLEIVKRSAGLMEVAIEEEGAFEIARRCRGTPRIANRLLRRVRDFAQILHDGKITHDVAAHALSRLGVDALGLDEMDLRLLRVLVDKFEGQPVGLDTLAAALGEESHTLEDVYEPYLLQEGFIMRTPRGRVATAMAFRHLGREPGPHAVPSQAEFDGLGS